MINLKKNDVVGKYTVEHQIKGGTLSSTYRVSDRNGNPCFLKLYDMSQVPSSMMKDDTVSEIAYSRQVKHENVISFTKCSTLRISSSVTFWKCEKSKRNESGDTNEPFCSTCVPNTSRSASSNK